MVEEIGAPVRPPLENRIEATTGIADLGRIKQAIWDAFHGTAQPTFAEGPVSVGRRRAWLSRRWRRWKPSSRTGPTTTALDVYYSVEGTASPDSIAA